MPFALIGFFLGIQEPGFVFEWRIFGLVVLCMIFARSAAMAFNRFLDRDIDELNERTKVREIPAGKIKPSSALTFVIVNCVFFVISTYFINKLCFMLSPVALIVVLGYSYTKRFTYLCHLVLGVGLALAPIGAFIAVTGAFKLLPLLFSFVVLFWVSGFDIIYALQDEDFDRSNSLNSIPVKLGRIGAMRLSEVLHFFCFIFLLWAGFSGNFSIPYFIGLAAFSGLLVYQHYIISPNDLSKVNLSFFTANGIGSVVFAVSVILDLYL
ncbi:MAG: putative 4-hydroxybenzoate polyprenyltransferase [Flavobacteriales bacterium]|nr:putative 4-hydroxybenzoate polyprenyltransferase [Flavobacteriales bacterium]